MFSAISNYISQITNGMTVNVKGKSARWTKVKNLKPGAKICITDDVISPSEVMFDEILEINHIGREQVYDIEVEGTHNFVGNGILAHNTYIQDAITTLQNDNVVQGLTLGKITKAMALTDTGNIGIGTTTPTARLEITGDTGQLLSVSNSTSSLLSVNANGNVGIGTSNPQYTLEVNGTGRLNDSAWTYASDLRLKENVASVSGGLSIIEKLNPVTFDYINGGKGRAGFIAQEVLGVLPDIVSTDTSTGMLGIRLEEMMPYVVKAIQEQSRQIGMLDENISSAQNEFTVLSSQFSALQNSLNISADGTLNVPKLQADHLTISADVNFATSALASLLSSSGGSAQSANGSLNDSQGGIDVLASLNTISAAVLGVQTQEATVSAKLDTLVSQVDTQEERIKNLEDKLAQIATSSAQSTSGEPKLTPEEASIASDSAVMLEGAQRPIASSSASTDSIASLQNDNTAFQNDSSASAQTSPEVGPDSSGVNGLALTDPSILLATDSASLGTGGDIPAPTFGGSDATISGQLTAYNLNIQNSLKSLGNTTLGNTLIAGDLTIDGTMSISLNSLNTPNTLFIQNSQLASGLDILNGQFIFDKNGTLTVSGTVLASQFSVKAGTTAGVGTIAAGQTDTIIENIYVDENSVILLTPHTSMSQTLAVADKIKGGFLVKLAHTEAADITFDYLIVGVKP